jgi:DNA-binding Xre family transcriptional regulator
MCEQNPVAEETMVRWKMDQLLQRYEAATGTQLKVTQLMESASLSTSTTYLVMKGTPIRISLKSIDSLLTFFSQTLGVLTISDLIEFEVDKQT